MKLKKKLFLSFLFASALIITTAFTNVNATNTTTNNYVKATTETKKASSKIDISKDFNYYISLNNYTFEYTGKEIKPKVTLYKSNSTGSPTKLKQNTDYKVSYKNNTEIGYAQITVTGIGKYKGTKTTGFNICKYDLSKAKISTIPNQEYNGKIIKPKITKIKYGNKTLKQDVDYRIYYPSYQKATPIGTIYMSIGGIGDFGGNKTVTFDVVPTKVKNVNATMKANGFNISWDKVKNCDFDGYTIFRTTSTTKNLQYKELANVSTKQTTYLDTTPVTTGKTYYYKVCTYKTINGRKYYSLDSNIVKEVFAQGVTFTVKSNNDSAYLKWNKVNGADMYQIFRSTSKNGEYKKIKSKSSNKKCSYTDTNIKPFTTYYYKIRCYAKTSSGKIYSKFTTIEVKTPVAKTKLRKAKYTGKSIILNWDKVSKIKGYKIYRATSLNGKYGKLATVSSKKTSYKDKKLSQGKVYYYKIRAYKIRSGKELQGQYSDIKYAITGTRTQQMNKTKLIPDKEFKKSAFKSYYKDYEKLIKKNTNSKMSTLKKVKTMYKYLVNHLYHKDGYHCKNFAATFASMCRVIGLDAYCATGETRASGGGYTAHTWTIVNINGTEYIFDASLERHNSDRKKNKKTVDYKYFFKTYGELPGVYKFQGYDNWFPFFMVSKSNLK